MVFIIRINEFKILLASRINPMSLASNAGVESEEQAGTLFRKCVIKLFVVMNN